MITVVLQVIRLEGTSLRASKGILPFEAAGKNSAEDWLPERYL